MRPIPDFLPVPDASSWSDMIWPLTKASAHKALHRWIGATNRVVDRMPSSAVVCHFTAWLMLSKYHYGKILLDYWHFRIFLEVIKRLSVLTTRRVLFSAAPHSQTLKRL
jgi:hypothetical protein